MVLIAVLPMMVINKFTVMQLLNVSPEHFGGLIICYDYEAMRVLTLPMTLRCGAVSKQLGPEQCGVARDVAVGNSFVLQMR